MPPQASQSSNIPPPPPGYTLDAASGSIPAPPPGYTLDQAPQAQQQPQQPPGFFQRLGQSLGIPTSSAEMDAATKQMSTPQWADLLGPGGRVIKGAVTNAASAVKGALNEAQEVGENIGSGQPIAPNLGKFGYAATKGTLNALPFIGPAVQTAGEDIAQKNYSGAAGGLTGAIGQAAFPEMLKRGTAAIDAIPSAERAGQAFNQVKAAAGDIPIDTTAPGNTALEIQRLSKSGGQMPKVVRDFITRATDPNQGPISYSEARDFYSNASRLSADEAQRLTPNMKRMAGQFRSDLGNSIQDAANQAGQGDVLQGAMSEYRNAMQMQDFIDMLKGTAVNTVKYGVPTAAGSAVAGHVLKKIVNSK